MKTKNNLAPYIPFKRVPTLSPLTEQQKKEISENLTKTLIDEELGAFNNQYEIADRCVERLKEMYINSITLSTIEVDGDDAISVVDLRIRSDLRGAQMVDYNAEKHIAYIEVSKYAFIDKDIINSLSSIIAHELMHYNVFVKREENGENNETVEWYGKMLQVMRNSFGMAYSFAHMMYTTYYQEVNAFVSQTAPELLSKIRESDKEMSRDDFKKMVNETEPVMRFVMNMSFYHNNKHKSDNELESEIYVELRKVGINWTPKEVREKMKKGYIVSRAALRDCYRNAMLALNQLNLEE